METPPVLISDDPIERVALKVQQLAAVKPALVRLLEWELDRELERAEPRDDARPFTPSVC
jgi:hypothetical protein